MPYTPNNEIWHQNNQFIFNLAEIGDEFGFSLAAGDFNGNGKDDLAVGVPFEDLGGITDVGAVNAIYGSSSGLTATGDQFWHENTLGINGLAESWDTFGFSLTTGDFNGDGFDDLAVGTIHEDIGSINNAGAVNAIYGSNSGLSAANNQSWHQNSSGIQGVAESKDYFGTSLTTGDFNGDGFDDLAVGAHWEDLGDFTDAGAVNVIFGSNSGLTAANNQSWHQNSSGIKGVAESRDFFGFSLAAGDFNGDGFDDLAVGLVGKDLGDFTDAGAVNAIYGSNSGLTAANNQYWHQNSRYIEGVPESGDWFGSSLAVGDFNGDGFDDLAVGVSGEDIGNLTNAGAVNAIYGSYWGLIAAKDQIWHQNSSGIQGVAESFDYFGSSLAVGDFNGDGFDDLAVGVVGEDLGVFTDAGAVNVIYGSNSGLTAANNQIWHQNSPGIEEVAERFDSFGTSLAVSDFNGDGFDDLAVGVPGEDLGNLNNITNAGAMNVIFGSVNGLIA